MEKGCPKCLGEAGWDKSEPGGACTKLHVLREDTQGKASSVGRRKSEIAQEPEAEWSCSTPTSCLGVVRFD